MDELQVDTNLPPLSARTLTTLPELLSALSNLQSQETALSASLSALLEAQEPLRSSLARISSIAPTVDVLQSQTTALSKQVGGTAKTAERVRSKVQALDEEMRRVREAGERVGVVVDLKSSLSALESAIESRDWESATRHCARAMSIPKDIIKGSFAESMVPTAESHLPPSETLSNARQQLLEIFRSQFSQAARSRDSAAISRFFKLFPSIGWEKEGLEAYSSFVIDLVRGRSQATGKTSSPMYYVAVLTSLFESIAMIVSQHQPIVEKYYGEGKMYNVIENLLGECDRVMASTIESWEEDRQVRRKLQDVSHSNFAIPARKAPNQPEDDETVDPREVDKLLSELAGMIGRWSLFHRFLADQLESDESLLPSSSPVDGPAAPSDPTLVAKSKSASLVLTLVTAYYVPLETWYLRTIIFKSHRLSTIDSSAKPPQNTTPDDVFYIMKGVLTRVLSTGHAICAEKTLKNVKDIVERDYTGVLKSKLDDVYAGSGSSARAAGGGGTVKGEKVERENRTTFMVLLNDLSISSAHMETLVKNLLSSSQLYANYLDSEIESTRNAVSSLLPLASSFRSVAQSGVDQLFNQLTRPKLRAFITDVYKDVSYNLDQDGYTAAEYNDIVRKRFTRLWDTLLEGFRETFTDANYHAFFSLTVEILVRHWEKQVMSMRFSELGAIRFDRDLRNISSYLFSQTNFGDAREKFQRLQQISTLLNLEEEEDPTEFYNGSGIIWRLSANDAKTVIALRV